MNQGKMTVLGSSMFIKKTFGEGYEMAVEKERGASSYAIQEFMKHNLNERISVITDTDFEITF